MSIELLDRTRKVMSLLTEESEERIGFSELCAMLSDFLSSNVYIISKRGKILGAGISEKAGSLPEFTNKVGDCVEERLNERFLSILSTKENVNLETLGFEEYDVDGLAALISPICIRGERLGSFFLYRKDRTYRIDDIILCEYCNTVTGLLLTNSLMVETGEIKGKKEAISSAIRALTELERKAVALVIHNLSGSEGLVITSKL
ncbi:MAG: GTP-sensing pleiotropic transcriptional regulator CodY, partial [Eubacterium sp.]|nr:GTP-sensing pleiotropic transcriptional regulator CodY [Eubacterium sp.]